MRLGDLQNVEGLLGHSWTNTGCLRTKSCHKSCSREQIVASALGLRAVPAHIPLPTPLPPRSHLRDRESLGCLASGSHPLSRGSSGGFPARQQPAPLHCPPCKHVLGLSICCFFLYSVPSTPQNPHPPPAHAPLLPPCSPLLVARRGRSPP